MAIRNRDHRIPALLDRHRHPRIAGLGSALLGLAIGALAIGAIGTAWITRATAESQRLERLGRAIEERWQTLDPESRSTLEALLGLREKSGVPTPPQNSTRAVPTDRGEPPQPDQTTPLDRAQTGRPAP